MATVPNIPTKTPPAGHIHEIWFDTMAGIDFRPEFYVDISSGKPRRA